MTREMEVSLAKIFVNSLEHMQNTDGDWRKVIDAFSRAAGSDPEIAKRGVKYVELLDEIMRGETK